jgi:hypothetical protein
MSIIHQSLLRVIQNPFTGEPIEAVPSIRDAKTTLAFTGNALAQAANWGVTAIIRPFATPIATAEGLAKPYWEKGDTGNRATAVGAGAVGAFGGIVIGSLGAAVDVAKAGAYIGLGAAGIALHGTSNLSDAVSEPASSLARIAPIVTTLSHPIAGKPLQLITNSAEATTSLEASKAYAGNSFNWLVTAPVRILSTPISNAAGLMKEDVDNGYWYLAPVSLAAGAVGGAAVGVTGAFFDLGKSAYYGLGSLALLSYAGIEALIRGSQSSSSDTPAKPTVPTPVLEQPAG